MAGTSKELIDNILTSDDPLKELGPGISSFHQLIAFLFLMFLCILLLHIPVLGNFRSYSFFEDSLIEYSSIGNMGFSQTMCNTASMIKGNTFPMKCKTGQITELVDWGVVTHHEDSQTCVRKNNSICTPLLNNNAFNKSYKDLC